MSKGQSAEKRIKNILKFFKMNENTISTVMGGVVVIVIAGLIFNYFRTSNLKTWQGMLLNEQGQTTTDKADDVNNDKIIAKYTVVKGDDLWHISERFYKSGYNYVDIMRENNIKGSGVITAGMELVIPKVEAKKITVVETTKITETEKPAECATCAAKEEVAAKGSIDVGEYVTKSGDTLWNIAVRAYGDGFQWTKIYWANVKTFGNPDVIHSDVKIVIPSLK